MWNRGYEDLLRRIRDRAEEATAPYVTDDITPEEWPLIDALNDIIDLCKNPNPVKKGARA